MFGATNVASATFFPAKGKQSGLIDALERVGGLLFYADYSTGEINALYSKGSPTATFTATRAGTATNATYITADGSIGTQAKVNNTPRISYAWYDTAGFHLGNKGIMVENATVNGLTYTYNLPNAAWDTGTCSVTTDTTAMVGFRRSILTATADSSTVYQAWASGISNYHAASAYIQRVTGTGGVYLRASTAQPWDLIPVTTSVARWSSTSTSLTPEFQLMLDTSGDVIRVTACQLENNPYPTSYVPSDSIIAARGAEVLKYLIAGNRNAAEETIYIKFVPCGKGFENDAVSRFLTSTITKRRGIRKASTGVSLSVYSNEDDSGTSAFTSTTSPSVDKSYVFAVTMRATGNPNLNGYFDSVADGTTNTDFTPPAWGANFYIGSSQADVSQLNGIIQSVAIFSKAHNESEVSVVTNLLK